MSEPTSVLTFSDLILEVAHKLGMAYYGVNAEGVAEIPVDAHDLAECKRVVNSGIRMFIHDAPKSNGWRWTKPIASVVLWPSVAAVAGATVVAVWDAPSGKTTITAGVASFYESMELRTITFTVGGSFTISDYVSPTVVKVTGNAAAASGSTWVMTSTGDYTLSPWFGGEYSGRILYVSNTGVGSGIEWISESVIREWRQNLASSSGTPYLAAVRAMTTGTPRRRWELIVHPASTELLTVQFQYPLYFDKLTAVTEVHPAPFGHDETVKAACLAVAEKEKNDAPGPDWEYYRGICLPNSYRIDAASAPRRLGYFGDPGSASESGDYRNSAGYTRPLIVYYP